MRFKAQDIFNMKATSIFLLTGLLCSLQGWSQEYKIKYANELSSEYRYSEALPVWEELLVAADKKKYKEFFILRKTLEASYFSENYSKTVYWFSKKRNWLNAQKSDSTEKEWVYYLNALRYCNLGSRFQGALDSALLANPNSTILNARKDGFDDYLTNAVRISDYQVRMYKKGSKGEEYGAFPYKTGILFVSNEFNHNAINRNYPRTGQYYSDVAFYDSLQALQKYKFYQKPFWIDFIYKNRWRELDRNRSHDGPVSFSPDKKLLFVTTNFKEKDKTDTVKYRRLQQHVYRVEGEELVEIEFPFNSPYFSTGHASMDAEGNVYFTSDRPGSIVKWTSWNGKKVDTVYSTDIWKTTFVDGSWSTPENLGESINTPGDEMFPFISNWGVLYFSSTEWGSMGGLDVFSSELDGKNPEHIGAPLNSTADDFSYYVDEETGIGYFSTNRDKFVDRIYAFNKPVFRSDLVVSLADCKGKALKNTEITITDLNNGESTVLSTQDNGQTEPLALKRNHEYNIVYPGSDVLTGDSSTYKAIEAISESVNFTSYYKRFISKVTVLDSVSKPMANAILTVYRKNGKSLTVNTDAKGAYTWRNEGDSKVDSVVVTAINYQDGRLSIPATENGNCIDTVVYQLPMKKLSDEQFIRLDMVLYNFDKYFLRPEGKVELDKLVAYMNAHPKYRVELSSHTDSRGSDKYNMKLSKNRAKSCVDYIISKGISKKLITAQGYGETRHVNNCANGVPCTKEQHQANRRTELKLFTPEEDALDNNKLKE